MEEFRKLISSKQVSRFLVVGTSAVITDFILYFLLINFLPPSVAKTISFIAGTVIAYIFNKHWTFEKSGKTRYEIVKFIVLYSSTLSANVAINALFLYIFPEYILLAFLFATGTSTVLNFIGQKWWVFKI